MDLWTVILMNEKNPNDYTRLGGWLLLFLILMIFGVLLLFLSIAVTLEEFIPYAHLPMAAIAIYMNRADIYAHQTKQAFSETVYVWLAFVDGTNYFVCNFYVFVSARYRNPCAKYCICRSALRHLDHLSLPL